MDALAKFADSRRVLVEQASDPTFGDLWKLWLADRKKDGKNNAIHDANWKSLAPVFANRKPSLLTADDYRAYARARFDLGRAPDTVHTELIRLRQCLRWADENNHVTKAPKVWLPSAGRVRERVLTPDEAIRLLSASEDSDPHIRLFIILLFSTGGRHTAILDLTWDRIDFVRGTINLDVDLPPDPMNKSWRKGRAEVVMGSLARGALKAAAAGKQKKHVIEHGGRRLKSCREGFRSACERAGIGWFVEKGEERVFKTDVTPHTIRHTVATWSDDENVDLKATAQMLGHADERTTRLIYTHARPEKTAAAVALVDRRLAALPGNGVIDGELADDGAS